MLQIEMAANGCVSGTLEEWPALDAELRARGIALPLSTNGIALKYVCRCVVAEATERARADKAEAALLQMQNAALDEMLRAKVAEADRLSAERESNRCWNTARRALAHAARWKCAAKAFRHRLKHAWAMSECYEGERDAIESRLDAERAWRKDAEAALSLSQSERVRLAEVVRTWVDKCNAAEAERDAARAVASAEHPLLARMRVAKQRARPVTAEELAETDAILANPQWMSQEEVTRHDAELTAARALVAALPKCDDCGKPASSVGAQYDSSGATVIHSCEDHGRYRAYLPYSDELRAYLAARGKEAGE